MGDRRAPLSRHRTGDRIRIEPRSLLLLGLVLIAVNWTSGSVEAAANTVDDTTAPGVDGRVTTHDGQGIAGITVDLFGQHDRGEQPSGYLSSTSTTADGTFELELPGAGCYRLAFIGPTSAGPLHDQDHSSGFCVADPTVGAEIDARLDVAAAGRIVGRVAFESGDGAGAVMVELFAAAGDGSRGSLIRSLTTRDDGSFRLEVGPGCYVIVIVPPGAQRVIESGRHGRHDLCIDADTELTSLRFTLEGDAPLASTSSTVELELFRLTNGLRVDPSGPLGRRKPLPPCVSDPFYGIDLDPDTGQPVPVAPLALSETTSNGMARSWAIEMARTGLFRHRPSSAQQQLFASLDLRVTAWGENIAWFDGYDVANTARVHFEGWRESETAHYCTLLAARFTHVGIGEYRVGDESWAVQNFHTIAPADGEPVDRDSAASTRRR